MGHIRRNRGNMRKRMYHSRRWIYIMVMVTVVMTVMGKVVLLFLSIAHL